jgi:hypothetical protein
MSIYRVGFSVFVFAAVVFSGFLSAGERQGPRISVKDPRYDFGVVAQGARPEHIFEIKNIGDELLEIKQLQPT